MGGSNISKRKGKTYPPKVLTAEEARDLVKACSTRSPTGIRNRALIVILYRGQLRISEALSLKAFDLDANQGTINVQRGKGGKQRMVAMDDGAFAVVQRWLDVRRQIGLTARSPLFCTITHGMAGIHRTRSGKPLVASYVRLMVKRMARRAGIDPKRVHPHTLRHTGAAELARENTPINEIQLQLGHSNIATTSRYLQHIAPQQLIERMRQRQWSV